VDRLELTLDNVTLPIAIMMVDAIAYPSLSRARKACRKGAVLIQRRHLTLSKQQQQQDQPSQEQLIGRVGDRVYTGDVICQQVRMGNGYFSVVGHREPPFELPVVYQDDHYALVNKPAGVVCYRQGAGQLGLMSVRAALPFVLTPPQRGTYSVLRRPASVHRLDKPTSGLLCVVKTKPAMLSMSRQFHDRIVKKTYMAIVNGIPEERSEASITSDQAVALGVDIDWSSCEPDTRWQLIDSNLDDKNAVTVWRAVKYVPSLHANDGYLTLVELKPKTGRYHQLRRHLAWNCKRPIVGDAEYDGGRPDARKFRNRGLFLCAARLTHEHPHYNSVEGRSEWNNLEDGEKYAGGMLWLSAATNKVMVSASVELPDKFHNLLAREEERCLKLQPSSVQI
jgi:23S rRNA-/tRNA-specific pseudouridylate synthase